ncbi:helicase-exonuclease AddAB subunit AddA [Acetobacterium paludosum]|uniref:ATP-dependent helicase/nuclease subunit A n=1 Tax=Acetobacterium paludosum TaxID=52693 RepID=A0A923HT66_9FIRM|nr:helicase-exonuclease AddAB subunit AddA [Acetobacterium paludosum]MBC3887297.1 helicase-exonuclease AddAB subunit AddA [Acetobacterium paludosum]
MKWTSDQKKAIENRETNMLVSAAAGSGKTALLIERVIRIILEEKVGVDELLILTFTRGAAGEMKNRLSQALSKELENPANDRSFLMKQMNSLGGASISTLHSFCLSVLRQYFHKGDIDPGFAIGNETEIALMLNETLEEVFEDEYLRANEKEASGDHPEIDFLELVEKYSGNKNDQALKDTVESLYRFLVTQPNSEDWCDKALSRFECDEETLPDSVWGQSLMTIIQTELHGAGDYAQKAAAASAAEGFEKTHEQMENEVQAIRDLEILMTQDLKKGLAALKTIKYERFKGNAKQDAELNGIIKKYRDEAKKSLESLKKSFAISLDEMAKELNELKKPMADLVKLTQKFWTAFQQKKAKKNLVDYNDLEQLTLKVLSDPEVAQEVKGRYKYVFLDEYQDTNEMQETILLRIVREHNYFMVGDVKQSIYRFRLADPTIFINKYETFGTDSDAENSLVTLNKNFRSAQGVINGINSIFSRIMTPGLGEIDYDEQAMLNKGLPHEGPYEKTEIHLIEEKPQSKEADEYEEENQEDQTAVEIEARFVARKIQSLVGTSFFDTRHNLKRTINYGDFGVLMRSVAGRGDVYLKIFSELGIPTYFDGGTNYYESLEITMILNLLNLMDNQHQDLPLLSVMTSPIGGFTTTECTKLRIKHPQGFFYQAVEAYRAEEKDALSEKLIVFYNQLNDWRNESKLMPVEDFLWKIYLESGYYAFVGALPGGEQRQCNLRILLKRAGDYKKSTLKGLYQFIRFVENMKKHKQDISPPAMVSSNEAVVRLMTVHKSKGLEFPIVFLSGVGKGFNKRSNNNQILFHKDLGICPDYVDLNKRFKHNSLGKEVCKAQSNMEMLSEEMRLLYVGMTRAEEKLYLVGTVKNPEKALEKWREEPDEYHLLKASSLLDWVMLGVIGGKNVPEISDPLELEDFIIYRHNEDTENSETAGEETVEAIALAAEVGPVELETKEISQKEKDAIAKRLNYRYPEKADNDLPSKMSVTEIKNVQKVKLEENVLIKKKLPGRSEGPKFLEKRQGEFTPAQRGTALHLLMEVIDLAPLHKQLSSYGINNLTAFLEKQLPEEVERLIQKEFLPEKLAKTIDFSKLIDFYTSPLGIRLLSAAKVRREIPFNYGYDPGKVRSEWSGIKEKITVQGIIDCAFMEEEQWVIIDYKTDFYQDPVQRDALLKGYEVQVNLYAEAMTALSGIPVKEKIIAFITMKENVFLNKS